MTGTKTSLNYDIINDLLQNSVCLTYNPLEPRSAWQFAKELQQEYEKKYNLKHSSVRSKTAQLFQHNYNPNFHYFSDGTLIHCYEPWERDAKKVKRMMKVLKIRGWQVKRIYAPREPMDIFKYSDFLRYISEQETLKNSYITDLYVEPLPSKEDFVKECFANENVLLTASKDEMLPSYCREFMALFADGRYYVIKDYNNPNSVQNYNKIAGFKYNYMPTYVYANEQIIPQDYLIALYQETEKHAWFASKEETDASQHQRISFDALIKMNKYVDKLFTNRTCLTVVYPNLDFTDALFMSPDLQNYAVFSDGLVVAANFDETYTPFAKALRKAYPDLDLHYEKAPKEYIQQLYRRLPEFQKSAKTIYIEMLKQKARKLKRMTELTHTEALNIVAQIAGWQNWRAVKIEDEPHARQLIGAEKQREKRAAEKNAENPLMWEYERFLQKQA